MSHPGLRPTKQAEPVNALSLIARALAENPETYDSTDTVLTALGEQQNYQMGQMMRRIYAGADPSRAIAGLSNTTFVDSAISSMADAGGEGSVIYDSALAFWQGFYPPNPS